MYTFKDLKYRNWQSFDDIKDIDSIESTYIDKINLSVQNMLDNAIINEDFKSKLNEANIMDKNFDVLNNTITINAHGGQTKRPFKVPKNIQILIPHKQGTDQDYRTPDASKDKLYEQDLYENGYLNYKSGWKLYLSGETINNMDFSPFTHSLSGKKSCNPIKSHDKQTSLIQYCTPDRTGTGDQTYNEPSSSPKGDGTNWSSFCPLYCTKQTNVGHDYITYKTKRKLKIKSCTSYTLEEFCEKIFNKLNKIPSQELERIAPDFSNISSKITNVNPLVIIPFTCNDASTPTKTSPTVPFSDSVTPLNDYYKLHGGIGGVKYMLNLDDGTHYTFYMFHDEGTSYKIRCEERGHGPTDKEFNEYEFTLTTAASTVASTAGTATVVAASTATSLSETGYINVSVNKPLGISFVYNDGVFKIKNMNESGHAAATRKVSVGMLIDSVNGVSTKKLINTKQVSNMIADGGDSIDLILLPGTTVVKTAETVKQLKLCPPNLGGGYVKKRKTKKFKKRNSLKKSNKRRKRTRIKKY
jgi:hypothetical protein